jgi:hypothetical protein
MFNRPYYRLRSKGVPRAGSRFRQTTVESQMCAHYLSPAITGELVHNSHYYRTNLFNHVFIKCIIFAYAI